MSDAAPRIEYVEARRVLLDAFDATVVPNPALRTPKITVSPHRQ